MGVPFSTTIVNYNEIFVNICLHDRGQTRQNLRQESFYIHRQTKMPVFGEKFVYGPVVLNEQQQRVARCRAEAAKRERELARKFAAKKRLRNRVVQEDVTDEEAGVSLQHEGVPTRDECPAVSVHSLTGMDGHGVLPEQDAPREGGECPEVNEEAAPLVRRSLVVPARFYERLAGPGESFLEYLQGSHSVLIFRDQAKKKWHVKGHKENVMACYTAFRELLAEWRRREAVAA